MRRRPCCAPGDHVHDLEVIRGRCARRGGQSAPESSIPFPPPLPLRGQRAPHLLRFRSRDDQVFMPSMLCRPRRAAGTQGTLGGASRHSRRRRPSAPSASPARCAPGAGNPAGRQGELRGSRDSRGTGGIEPWGSWGVRSSRGRPLSCARCSLPAAPPPACCRDPGEVLGGPGGPEQPLTPPPGAPRAPSPAPSLEASRATSRSCAVASQQPSYSLPARRGRAPPPRHPPRARRPRRPPPLLSQAPRPRPGQPPLPCT